jgi:hypothetical protein
LLAIGIFGLRHLIDGVVQSTCFLPQCFEAIDTQGAVTGLHHHLLKLSQSKVDVVQL